MSYSTHPLMNPNSTLHFDEHRWILHIRRSVEQDSDPESDSDDITHVSIFHVPKPLTLASPESYVPQQVSLGPYHHFRPDLQQMEDVYKLPAARRVRKQLHSFQNLVDHLAKSETRIRACYRDRLSNLNGETLAWIMAVDSCFLIEFLHAFSAQKEMLSSVDVDAVIRDVVMLENQIPFVLVRKTLEFMFESMDEADEFLHKIVMGVLVEISPFNDKKKKKKKQETGIDEVKKCAHLLDLLYNFIVPKFSGGSNHIGGELTPRMLLTGSPVTKIEEGSSEITPERQNTNHFLHKDGFFTVSFIKKIVFSRPMKCILKMPLRFISNLPGMILIKQLHYMCSYDPENGNRPALMDEIDIPSVTQLSRAGVQFSPSDSGISGIKFDGKTATLYLPTIRLDINTEVVIRNLVAYEACGASAAPLIFTRYTELMTGIVDTSEDAKLLREKGIILNHLQSDQEVAELWNGMSSQSIRLTKVPFLDTVIQDVNAYYSRRWRVMIGKLIQVNSLATWKLILAVVLVILVSLQTLCSLSGCSRRIK